jgi:hypothetical protein
MSLPVIHFKDVRSTRHIVTRPLCERGNVICHHENSSALRHEVTCKVCLKRLMDTATFAPKPADTAREQAR